MKHGNVAYPFEEQRQSSAAENKSANVDVMNTAPHIVQDEDAESSQASLDVNLNDTVADHLNELDTSLVEQTIDFDVLDSAEKEDDVDWDVETAGLTIVLEDSGGKGKWSFAQCFPLPRVLDSSCKFPHGFADFVFRVRFGFCFCRIRFTH